MHTALDNAWQGVNNMICNQLQLNNRSVLIPQTKTIKKLTTFVPKEAAENIRNALFKAGAGNIGNYSNCSFNTEGIGTYKGNENTNPTIGEKGEIHQEAETQVSVIFAKHTQAQIIKALFKTHPYEEVAYEIVTLENNNQHIGMGMLGELENAMAETEFLKYLKTKMQASVIRHSNLLDKSIKKVAVLGGSGSFAIQAAKASGADVLVTSDLKYHDFFLAENSIILADIGHYESEQYTKNGLVAHLTKKITNFAVVLSKTNTNPVQYF
ncbi:UNVERIFIED_CONTAM: hypothetical protein GTU68_021661 [Idotea baltica]|nr:hypothetical protein [Idotea baltica]